MFSDVNNHRHIFHIYNLTRKGPNKIQSSFDLEQPIKDINGQNIQEKFESSKKHDSALFKF